jgi:delta 1-pyrroline-5-carboxylate dehydrogenase
LTSVFPGLVKRLRTGSSLDEGGDKECAKGSAQKESAHAVDVGAVISDARFSELEALIRGAVAQGASLLAGGKRLAHPEFPRGVYFEPTVLAGVTREMDIAQKELFAPVMLVMRASSVEDAVAIANSTCFGLGGSVFGHSQRDIDFCMRNMVAGNIAVNDFASFYMCQLPFGGAKASGYGVFAGKEGLRGMCRAKSVCVDRWSFVRTNIPTVLAYPIGSPASAWAVVELINSLLYSLEGWRKPGFLVLLVKELLGRGGEVGK